MVAAEIPHENFGKAVGRFAFKQVVGTGIGVAAGAGMGGIAGAVQCRNLNGMAGGALLGAGIALLCTLGLGDNIYDWTVGRSEAKSSFADKVARERIQAQANVGIKR